MEMREEGGEHYYSADEADGVAEERCCEAPDEGGEVEGCVAWHLGGGGGCLSWEWKLDGIESSRERDVREI